MLYDKAGYQLPLDLQVGDKVQILSAGAYTTTYSLGLLQRLPAAEELLPLSAARGLARGAGSSYAGHGRPDGPAVTFSGRGESPHRR